MNINTPQNPLPTLGTHYGVHHHPVAFQRSVTTFPCVLQMANSMGILISTGDTVCKIWWYKKICGLVGVKDCYRTISIFKYPLATWLTPLYTTILAKSMADGSYPSQRLKAVFLNYRLAHLSFGFWFGTTVRSFTSIYVGLFTIDRKHFCE